MARNVISNATVNLNVNGQQAAQQLDRLRQRAGAVRNEIQAMETGAVPMNRRRLTQLYQEFQNISRQISQCQSEIGRVNDVMRRLNTASPRELMSALRTLKSQLNALERGSAAWEEHRRKIQMLEQELNRVNSSLAISRSRWQRLNQMINDYQTSVMGAVAAIVGLIQTGRNAVNNFAQMGEALADTQKFTGLSEKEVKKLNEAFKQIDTRNTREQLNALASEAGRLGKNTSEAVKGYVEAGQIIKVALDDLGEGATQTIAKLSNIFNVEQKLGTKQAMMAIGSTVNELSQNCTAGANYLVEFTQRMAGIGAQAGLTIPQIMAFAAVLDSNGQACEMSATAVQQVLMKLANKNKEFATILGLDAEELAKTLKTSAKDGIMMYLEAIKKLSDKTSASNATVAIAPLFKDMGLDAARLSAVLSTLANKIEDLKWQFGEADKAFNEAVSVNNEYNIFNSTKQAEIDKAKNRMHELSVELGEKLYPVMKHVYSSSSLMLKTMMDIIKFAEQNKWAIITLTTTIVAYTAAIYANTIKTHALTIATKALAAAKSLYAASVRTAHALTIGFNGVIALLTGNIGRARAAMRAMTAAMGVTPWAVLAAAVAALTVTIIRAATKSDEFAKKIRDLSRIGAEYRTEAVKEQQQIDRLIGTLKGASEGTKEYRDAKETIIRQYGKYLGGLIDEKGRIIDLAQAYDILSEAVSRSMRKRAIAAQEQKIEEAYLENVGEKLSKLEISLKSYGATPLQVQTVIAAMNETAAKGQKLSGEAANIIRELSKNNATLDNKTGKKLSSAQAAWAAFTGISFADVESPTKIIKDILHDYDTRSKGVETVRNMDPDKKLPGQTGGIMVDSRVQLDAVLAKLDKIIETGEESTVAVPKDFRPEAQAKTTNNSFLQTGSQPVISNSTGRSLTEIATEGVKTAASQHDNGLITVTPKQAEEIKNKIVREMRLQGLMQNTEEEPERPAGEDFNYVSEKEAQAKARKEAAEARKEEIKARAEYRQGLEALKAEYTQADADIIAKYAAGEIDYITYLQKRMEAEQSYCDKSRQYMERHLSAIKGIDVTEDKDYQAMMQRREAATTKYTDKIIDFQNKSISRREAAELDRIKKDEAINVRHAQNTLSAEIKRQDEITRITVEALEKRLALYAKGSEKWEQIVQEIEQKYLDGKAAKNRAYEQKAMELRKQYEKVSADQRFRIESTLISQLFAARKISYTEFLEWRRELQEKYRDELPGTDADSVSSKRQKAEKAMNRNKKEIDDAKNAGIITEKEADSRKKSLVLDAISESMTDAADKFGTSWISTIAQVATSFYTLWQSAGDGAISFADKMQMIGNAAAATFAAVSEGMRIASEFAQANAEIEIAKVEKRYEREKELAQGNTAITTALEQEKQAKIAEIKNKAQEAAFSMQVIQAVGQSIIGAINAYTSTAAIPVIGPTLAPDAAAIALAAGVANVALLKKQAEASKAQGYSEGGYTPKGRRDDVAGMVHAGEWVASQDLVNNPEAAAVITLLERAQRSGDVSLLRPMAAAAGMARKNNYVGSITFDDASRVVATVSAARAARASEAVVSGVNTVNSTIASAPATVTEEGNTEDTRLADILERLSKRLDEPFVTVNSVTGPNGINDAYNNYYRIINNKKRYK